MSRKNVIWRMSMIVMPLYFLSSALGQSMPLEQRLQAMQQASAISQQQLHSYQWIESTTLTIDGKAKEPKQSLCSYSADGHLIKKPMGGSGEPQISGGPLKKHIIRKKVEEFQEEMAEVSSLTALYLPLNNGRLRDALHTRRVDYEHEQGAGFTVIVSDYAKPGDQLRITLNPDSLQIQRIVVQTYFDSPRDTLTADVRFSELADGTVYPSVTTINATGKKLQIATVSSDFSRPAQ